MATIASDAGRVYAAMRHGEVCKKELWGKIPHLEDHFYRLQIGGDAFSGLGIQWVHLSAGDRIGGS